MANPTFLIAINFDPLVNPTYLIVVHFGPTFLTMMHFGPLVNPTLQDQRRLRIKFPTVTMHILKILLLIWKLRNSDEDPAEDALDA